MSEDELNCFERGIETARGRDLSEFVLLKMADYFADLANYVEGMIEKAFLTDRSLYLNKSALHKYCIDTTSKKSTELTNLIDNAIIQLAKHYFDNNDFKNGVSVFENVNSPFAAHFAAEFCMKLSEMTNCSKIRQGYVDKTKKFRESTIALLKEHENNALRFFIDEIRMPNSSSHCPEDPNIMGHILYNGNVRDKEGKELTVVQYLEKITPQKNPTMTARDFLSNFMPEASPKMTINLTSSFEAVAAADFQHVEPDSTSEDTAAPHVKVKRSKRSVVHSRPGQLFKEELKQIICPVRECKKTLKHEKNVQRHIQTYHGIVKNGRTYIERIFCNLCEPVKENLNMCNYTVHHSSRHSGEEKKFSIIRKEMPPIVYKNEE